MIEYSVYVISNYFCINFLSMFDKSDWASMIEFSCKYWFLEYRKDITLFLVFRYLLCDKAFV